jgi:hypothetical protein
MPPLLRSLHLAPALLYLAGLHANSQEPVPLDRAREFARHLNESANKLANTPITVDADVLNPHGIHAGESGALVVPDRNLTAAALDSIGEKPLPVGELFLRNVTFTRDGSAVANDRLQHITVAMQDTRVQLPIFFLAARKTADGKLELVVFGKDMEPLATSPLGKVPAKAQFPIELTAEKRDENSGLLTLKIVGQYEAELVLQRTGTQ